MKKLFTLGALLIAGTAFAQTENVGIGTVQPDKSAILDLSSSNKGFLLPRMSESQRLNIAKPAQGLQVYQTDGTAGLYVFNGKDWENASKSVAAATDPWLRGGNSIDPGEYIGTTNNEPLQFKVNGFNSGLIGTSATQNTFLGYLAGRNSTGTENTAIGHYSMFNAVAGSYNVAVGSGTLIASTPGSFNVAVGRNALRNNTANANIAVGQSALENNTSGGDNFAIGTNALGLNTVGNGSFALGSGALGNLNTPTSSSFNMAVGFNALNGVTTGSYNTAIGNGAGQFLNGNSSGNILIGPATGPATAQALSNKLFIDNQYTLTPIIGGDLQQRNLKFHLGATSGINNSTGYLAIGDFTGATPAILNFGGGSGTNTYRLVVQDGILTEKLKVALKGSGDWADYVFDTTYNLMSLDQVETFIKENKHLPNVPSAEEMVQSGLDVSKTSAKLMEKIEELTLYIINMNKEISALKADNAKSRNKE